MTGGGSPARRTPRWLRPRRQRRAEWLAPRRFAGGQDRQDAGAGGVAAADRRHPDDTVRDLRDRALIATLTYGFARVGAALKMRVEDLQSKGSG
jgi:hypothetical protein